MTPVSEPKVTESVRAMRQARGGELRLLREALHGTHGGAWMREASLTLALAAQASIALDESGLLLCDVRDLMAAEQALRALAARYHAASAKRTLRHLALIA